jgi:2-methylisocitrate lyase-like PEP mutase family enzyme
MTTVLNLRKNTAANAEKAARFRALAQTTTLVLPNAWDAASAALIAAAGAPAVATTSGGVAWSLGAGDGQRLGRAEMAAAVARIAASVDVPVTADIEGGYDGVAETVRAVVAAGAVGVNLEDSAAPGGPLHTIAEQAERIRAARAAAVEAGLPDLWINVRTDVYLFGIGPEAGRLDDVLDRAAVYAESGADGLFVPGLLDLATLAELCGRTPLPVNAMAGPGGPTVAELAAAGVRRVSLGTALAEAAYTAARDAAAEFLREGTYAMAADALGFGEVNALFG